MGWIRRVVVLSAVILLPVALAVPAGAGQASKATAGRVHNSRAAVAAPNAESSAALRTRAASTAKSAPRKLAAATNYTVGVDNGSPDGHNFEYTDYFPNTLKIPDTTSTPITIDFAWNAGSPDGFHTVTLFKPGNSPTNYPLLIHSADDPGAPAELNPSVTNPFPLPACATGACSYNGSADISSGAAPTAVGAQFVVTITGVAAGTTINYSCLIHPARMHGTIQVVSSGADTTQSATAAAAAQYNTSTTQAFAAESAANKLTGTKNANGTMTWQAVAATATPLVQNPVEVLEMLPPSIPVTPGDTVNWTTMTQGGNEIHTVTFPDMATISDPATVAALSATEPIPTLCENGSQADTVAPGGPPPSFGCATPADVENGFIPQPFGTTTIATGNTVGSSGLISTAGGPFANHYSYTFPNNGTFSFMCHIHPHMFGTVFTAGYHNVATDGGIFTHGHADFLGSMGGHPLNKPVVSAQGTPDQQGYYEVATDGGIFTFGNAKFMGSMGDKPLNKPINGMAVTPDGGGYYEVASDGGIFTFGDAKFMGSMGGKPLNKPIVGMAVTPDGGGYYEVASDGGIFTFGDAAFQGSMGGSPLNSPVVGMAATNDGAGYYEVAADGGIFTFGTAQFFGSEGGLVLNKPIVGMQLTTSGNGYRLVATDGGIFTHGDAQFFGSEGGIVLNQPIVGIFGS
jgi:plastocyanin